MKKNFYWCMFAVCGILCLLVTRDWSRLIESAENADVESAEIPAGAVEREPAAESGGMKPVDGEIGGVELSNVESTEAEPDIEIPYYGYEWMDESYFADAVFIGDSRTVGMYEYGGLQEISHFYCATGLSVHKLFTAKIVPIPGQKKKITLDEALPEQSFGKIYLMIGINEMGTGTAESFLKKYEECVAHLRELQPDATIYLQSIMQVTKERSEKGDVITKEGIDIRNEGIRQLADEQHIFYLDVNEAVCDGDGYLIADYTSDGVHLKAQYIELWKQYLQEHGVVWYGTE